mgnify:CR=1 FL=1
MNNLIVVLMGGLSGERKISFLTGKACSEALKKRGYKVVDLDAKGYFVEELRKLKPKIVFNALHGKYGEDGFVQSILESLKIPYTHSGVFASSIAMDKELSRIIFKKNKLSVPKYFSIEKGYEGDVLVKMYKSARYYFKNKSAEKKDVKKRRQYVGLTPEFREAVDEATAINTFCNGTPPLNIGDYIGVNADSVDRTKLWGWDFSEPSPSLKEIVYVRNRLLQLISRNDSRAVAYEAFSYN